ncbi:hypothetical protein V1514DRAFT_289266 [Lipomyces japonicus]|uniref:uncharacterized protein n=1 Tax=Lipomyces japonicus TaxID=56871 RepID=UPI0034CF9CAD
MSSSPQSQTDSSGEQHIDESKIPRIEGANAHDRLTTVQFNGQLTKADSEDTSTNGTEVVDSRLTTPRAHSSASTAALPIDEIQSSFLPYSRISMESNRLSPPASLLSPSNLNLAFQYSAATPSLVGSSLRRASTASDAGSITSLRRDLSALGFNQSSIGTNAISSILNSPSASTNVRTPTSYDIPPVNLTNIDIVSSEQFVPYLHDVAQEFQKYKHSKGDIDLLDNTDQVNSIVPPRSDSLLSTPTGKKKTDHSSFISVLDSQLEKDEGPPPQNVNQRAEEHNRKNETPRSIPIASLSTIPKVYFEPNFKLENPRVFDVVSERSEIVASPTSSNAAATQAPSSNRRTLANNAVLQEKLSWYLDTVELHLITEISKASSSFFAALGDLRNLHSETSNAVDRIAGLRRDLNRVDTEQAEIGLEIVRLQKRRENVRKLDQSVSQVVLACSKSSAIEAVLRDENLEKAWDAIREVETIIDGTAQLQWEYPLSNLTSLPGVQSISDNLNSFRARVSTEYQIRFTTCLLDDIRRHIASVPTQETLDRLSRTYTNSKTKLGTSTFSGPRPQAINTSYLNLPETLKPQLWDRLQGLENANAVDDGIQRYRDAIMREVKNLIKRNLPTNSVDDTASVSSNATGRTATTAQKSATLERMLREMKPQDFESMLVDIFTGISELLRRLSMHQKLLLDLSSSMQQLFDISDLITAAADITQVRTMRIINVRGKEIGAFADQNVFSSVFNLVRVFLAECEAITGKFGQVLLNTVMAQRPQVPEPVSALGSGPPSRAQSAQGNGRGRTG